MHILSFAFRQKIFGNISVGGQKTSMNLTSSTQSIKINLRKHLVIFVNLTRDQIHVYGDCNFTINGILSKAILKKRRNKKILLDDNQNSKV